MRSPQPDLPTADIQPVIRRADIMALCLAGRLTCIEIKSGLPDFRSDLKWPQYRPWCDAFYFAVPHSFPQTVLPDDVGVMVVDVAAASGYGPAIADAAIIRPAPMHKLAPARRRSVTHRFAMLAAQRLNRMEDPALATVLRTALRSE